MKKNQIIILVIILIVVFGVIVGLALTQKEKLFGEKETNQENGNIQEEAQEIFSLSAIVSSVDAENGVLTVEKDNKEYKVILSETAKLIKLEFPFDPNDPPANTQFTPIQTEIEISDFQAGDNVFIKAKENIAGKTEFGDVDFVHILP